MFHDFIVLLKGVAMILLFKKGLKGSVQNHYEKVIGITVTVVTGE